LLACHTLPHLIRAIGHHIDRLACRSVSIMGWPFPLEGPEFTPEYGSPHGSKRRPMCRVPDQF
jgi:hypothetical protein